MMESLTQSFQNISVGDSVEISLPATQSVGWFGHINQYIKDNTGSKEAEDYYHVKDEIEHEDGHIDIDSNGKDDIYSGIDPTVMMSSNRIFNNSSRFNKLTNGLLLSPFQVDVKDQCDDVSINNIQYLPPTCIGCNSFINRYCKVQETVQASGSTTHKWTCSICNKDNPIDQGTSGVRSITQVKHGLGWWSTNAYKTVFSKSSDLYDIKFKSVNNNNLNDNSSSKSPIKTKGQNGKQEVDGDDSINLNDSISIINNSQDNNNNNNADNSTDNTTNNSNENRDDDLLSITSNQNMYIFIIDESLSFTELNQIYSSIQSLIRDLPKDTLISLITFSKTISIYEISNQQIGNGGNNPPFIFCEIISGGQSLDNDRIFKLKRKKKLFIDTITNGWDGFERSFESILEGVHIGSQQQQQTYRSLGVAVECGLALSGGSGGYNNGRLFVFISGEPNYGPGALHYNDKHNELPIASLTYQEQGSSQENNQLQSSDYYKVLGHEAYQKGLSIDIHFCGYNSFMAKYLTPLTWASGYLYLFYEISNNNNQTSIIYLNMKNSIKRDSGVYCKLDIHSPEQFNLVHLIGQTSKVNQAISKKYLGDDQVKGGKQQEQQQQSFEITNLSRDSTVALYFDLLEDLPQDYLYIQFVIHLIDKFDNRILRVITKKLKITGSYETFLSSINYNVLSVLMAKKILVQPSTSAINFKESNYQEQLDKELKKYCLGSSLKTTGWFRKVIVIPDLIKNLIKKFYIIRNGLFFGNIVQSDDEFQVLKSYFISSNFENSIQLLLPKLIFVSNDNLFIRLNYDIEYMNSNNILIFDNQTSICLFIGSNTCKDVKRIENAKRYIQNHIKGRVPQPFILEFDEYHTNARWLKSRLFNGINLPRIRDQIPNPIVVKQIAHSFITDDISYSQYENSILVQD